MTDMAQIRSLSATGLHNFIQKIFDNRGQGLALRERVITEAKNNDSFIAFIEQEIGFEDDSSLRISIPEKLRFTEEQFRSATHEEEKILYEIVNPVCTRENVASACFWASLTIGLIEANVIQASFLAAKSNPKNAFANTGISKIDTALASENEDYDGLSNFILRSLTGHQAFRNAGMRDLYQTCVVSKAWLRFRLSQQSSNNNALQSKEVHDQLTHSAMWNSIAEKGVSKLTVISDENIFSGLTHFLVTRDISNKKECDRLMSHIGAQTTWRSLGAFKALEISEILSNYWEEVA